MSRVLIRSIVGAIASLSYCVAFGQQSPPFLPPTPVPVPGWDFCETIRSPDYEVAEINDFFDFNFHDNPGRVPLFSTSLGIRGTVGYAVGCPFVNGYTVSLKGRFGFGSGPIGSVQSTRDDNMQYTFGMPDDPGNSFGYACVTIDTDANRQLFGNGQLIEFFEGV